MTTSLLRSQLITVSVLAVLLFSPSLSKGTDLANDSPRPTISVPQTTIKPALMAEENDPAWSHAVTLPDLTLSLGATPPTIPIPATKVQVMWDADYLYVRFICHDTEIYTPIHGRDAPIYQADAVEVFLDPVGDAHQWIELEFNADNDVFDQIFLCTTEPKNDSMLCLTGEVCGRDVWNFLSWDLKGLRSKAVRLPATNNAQDWIVDVAIPAKEILRRSGLKQFAPMTMRGDFLRYKYQPPAEPGQPRKLMPLNWSPVASGRPHHSPGAYGYITLVGATAPAGSSGPSSNPGTNPTNATGH